MIEEGQRPLCACSERDGKGLSRPRPMDGLMEGGFPPRSAPPFSRRLQTNPTQSRLKKKRREALLSNKFFWGANERGFEKRHKELKFEDFLLFSHNNKVLIHSLAGKKTRNMCWVGTKKRAID